MKWRDAISFVKLLSTELGGVITVTAEGKTTLDLEKLPAVVQASDRLATAVLEGTTDLRKEELADMRVSDVVEVLDEALRLNLNEVLLGKLKAVGARVGSAFGAKPQA